MVLGHTLLETDRKYSLTSGCPGHVQGWKTQHPTSEQDCQWVCCLCGDEVLGQDEELDPKPLGLKEFPLIFPSSSILAEGIQDFLGSFQVILQFRKKVDCVNQEEVMIL